MAEEVGILSLSVQWSQSGDTECTHQSAFDIANAQLEPDLFQILTQKGTAYLIRLVAHSLDTRLSESKRPTCSMQLVQADPIFDFALLDALLLGAENRFVQITLWARKFA